METIRFGSRGEKVATLQRLLNIEDDGIFGGNTKRRVELFQRENGLYPDGIVGPKTWDKLLGRNSESSTKLDWPTIVDKIIAANLPKLTTTLNNKNDQIVTFDPTKHLVVVAIRGFSKERGNPYDNDRGIYDDAHFIHTPTALLQYDANTDPSGFRKGSGFGQGKGMAVLNEGVWFYGKGPHNGRPSFRQCAPVEVTRDGNPPYFDRGWFGINWHRGGSVGTSSLGCQTNDPSEYEGLRDYIYKQLDILDNPKLCNDWARNFDDKVGAFPYILVDRLKVENGIYTV